MFDMSVLCHWHVVVRADVSLPGLIEIVLRRCRLCQDKHVWQSFARRTSGATILLAAQDPTMRLSHLNICPLCSGMPIPCTKNAWHVLPNTFSQRL